MYQAAHVIAVIMVAVAAVVRRADGAAEAAVAAGASELVAVGGACDVVCARLGHHRAAGRECVAHVATDLHFNTGYVSLAITLTVDYTRVYAILSFAGAHCATGSTMLTHVDVTVAVKKRSRGQP